MITTRTSLRTVAAAVVVVLLSGCTPAGNAAPPSSRPESPSATPPRSASTAPSAEAGQPEPLVPHAGLLEPGRYRVGDPFPATFDVTLEGDNWDTYAADGCCVMVEQSFHQPPGLLFFATWTVDEVYADPCRHVLAEPFGAGVDDLVAAFRAVPAFGATDPVPVEVGGMTGRRMTLAYPHDLDVSGCMGDEFWVWGFEGENTRYVPPGYADGADELWILDVDGTRIVVDGILSEGTDFDRAKLERMVESIDFVSADPAP